MGQGVVLTTKVSHDVQTGLGGNTGGPIGLPADTQTQLLFQCKTILNVSLMSGIKLKINISNFNVDYITVAMCNLTTRRWCV